MRRRGPVPLPTGGGTLVRFGLPYKLAAPDGVAPSAVRFRGGCSAIELRGYRLRKWILRPAPPRHGLLYERSALLVSATEELLLRDSALERQAVTAWPQERQLILKWVLPQGLAP
jgi:hypothetical protein